MAVKLSSLRASSVLILAVVLVPVLSGCSVQSIVENATGGQVDVGGNSVPKDFPAEVPLIDGEVVYGGSLGSGESQVWNVTIKVTDLAAFDTISASMAEAGFTPPLTGSGELEGGVGGAFENENYGLLVVVSKDGNDGFIANYTVTTKAP